MEMYGPVVDAGRTGELLHKYCMNTGGCVNASFFFSSSRLSHSAFASIFSSFCWFGKLDAGRPTQNGKVDD